MKAALSALTVVGLFLPVASNAALFKATGTIAHSCSIDDSQNIALTPTDQTKLQGSTTLNMSQNGSTVWTLDHSNDTAPSGEVVDSEFYIQNFGGNADLYVGSGDTETATISGEYDGTPTMYVKIRDINNEPLKAGSYMTTATLTCVSN